MADNYAKLHLVGPSFLRGDESKEEVYIEDGGLTVRIPYFEVGCTTVYDDAFCSGSEHTAILHIAENVQSFALKKESDGYTLNYTTKNNVKHDSPITDSSAIESIRRKYGWKTGNPYNHL